MTLLLLPLVALAAGVAYAAGGRRVALAVGGGGAVLLVLATVLVGGVESRRDAADGDDVDTETSTAPAELAEADTEPPLRQPDVVLVKPAGPYALPPPIAGLADGDVRLVEVKVSDRFTFHQCAAARPDAAGCAEGVYAVANFDDPTTVLVEFAEQIMTAAGPIDCVEEPCVLAVYAGATALWDVPLAFGDGPAEPRVVLEPRGDLQPGQEVTVTISGLPPLARGTVAFCAATGDDTPRCEETDATLAADRTGHAAVRLRLAICGGRERCALRLVADGAAVRFAELAYASPPGPDLDGTRVAAGVGAAGALLLAALVLIRRTDWTNPDGDPFAGIDLAHTDPFAGIDLSVDPDGDWL